MRSLLAARLSPRNSRHQARPSRADWFSGSSYGRIMGAQWTGVVLTAAAGPLLVGVVRDATGGYGASFTVLGVLFFVASGVILASGHVKQSHTVPSSTGSSAPSNTTD